MSDELVERVTWKINRDSAEDKVRDFLDWMKAVKRDVKHVVSKINIFLEIYNLATTLSNWALPGTTELMI